ELRVVSNSDGPLQWTVGAFYKNDDSRSNTPATLLDANGAPLTPAGVVAIGSFFGVDPSVNQFNVSDITTKFKQGALFGEVSYKLTQKFEILGGLRWFNEKRDTQSLIDGVLPIAQTGPLPEYGTPTSASNSETVLDPKVTLTFHATDNALIYASAAEGF